MNVAVLKSRCKELEKDSALSYYEALQYFMFEQMLSRISISQYNSNLILKGGFLISALLGTQKRTTRDTDFNVKNIKLNTKTVKKIINDIVALDVDDTKFLINSIKRIKEKDVYYGFRCELTGIYKGLKVIFDLDITTGDVITPSALKYPYVSLFDKRVIYIYSYTIETILAEKVETILKRGQYNSRMKDYYDVYTIAKYGYDKKKLINAIRNTFKTRNSDSLLKDYETILNNIINSSKMKQLWQMYLDKNKYAKKLPFNRAIGTIKKLIQ